MDPQLLLALTLVVGFCLLVVTIIVLINNSYKSINHLQQAGADFVTRLNAVILDWQNQLLHRIEKRTQFLEETHNLAQLKTLQFFQKTTYQVWSIFSKAINYLLHLTRPHTKSEVSAPIVREENELNNVSNKTKNYDTEVLNDLANTGNEYEQNINLREQELIALMQKAPRDEKMFIALELGDFYGDAKQPEEQYELYKWVLENASSNAKVVAKNKLLAL